MTRYVDIRYEVADPVATITLNRPDRLNAFRGQTMLEIREAVRRAEADERVVGIVITGTGRGFSAGLDSEALAAVAADPGSSARSAEEKPDEDEPPALFSYLLRTGKPVIAAVNGVCAGGGFVLALMCDLRFVAEAASFTTVFSRRGLVAEHGTSWLLPRVVGTGRALDLLWSSRKVGADEAYRMGLADRVVPGDRLLEAAADYVRGLADTAAPESFRVTKRLVYRHLATSFEVATREAEEAMQASLRRDDVHEGIASFTERRPPRFGRVGNGASPEVHAQPAQDDV